MTELTVVGVTIALMSFGGQIKVSHMYMFILFQAFQSTQ